MPAPDALQKQLAQHGQQHVLAHWETLAEPHRQELIRQIDTLDLPQIERLFHHTDAIEQPVSPADQALPPATVVRQPRTAAEHEQWRQASRVGEELLAAGKVAAVVVAGGQGTRLGFPQPKGMFPIGPVSEHSLFRFFAEQLQARGRRSGRSIPYLVMTSDATDDETQRYFADNNNFGLNADELFFFRQGNMPAVDASTGRLLLEDKHRLAQSPDGHGGILKALHRSGALDFLTARGIELLYYHQVDNPTAIVCDPAFLGWHKLQGAEISTKVVEKTHPTEKMGAVCEIDGVTQILEYSDLTPEQAARTVEGQPVFWAGNMAIHGFSVRFLERLCDGKNDLPFHRANKIVPFLDEAGNTMRPEKPNAVKFERFIFDTLPLAEVSLVVEADRAREFNPVKNADGADSPATAKAALSRIGREWLQQAGATVPEDAIVEIAPLFALDADELAAKIPPGQLYSSPVWLH